MSGQLFNDLFIEDVDGPKLNQLPQMLEAFELYKSKFSKICEELVTFGLKESQNRGKERLQSTRILHMSASRGVRARADSARDRAYFQLYIYYIYDHSTSYK